MDPKVLAVALLWLRNHYDVGHRSPELKTKVLKRIDRVLADCDDCICLEGLTKFRELYGQEETCQD